MNIHWHSGLYQQRITAIELTQEKQVVDARARYACCHRVSPTAFLPPPPPPSSRPLLVLFLRTFFSLSLLPDRTESESLAGELVYFPIERRSTERARDGYLRRANQTYGPDVIEPRYFIVRAFELRVLVLLTRTGLLRAFLFLFLSTSCTFDDWKIIYRMTCRYYEVYTVFLASRSPP